MNDKLNEIRGVLTEYGFNDKHATQFRNNPSLETCARKIYKLFNPNISLCLHCDGTKKRVCTHCKGASDYREICRGPGAPFGGCGGKKKLKAVRGAKGSKVCWSCKGDGLERGDYEDCWTCKGNGFTGPSEEYEKKCHKCDGEGSVVCRWCNGSLKIDCEECSI